MALLVNLHNYQAQKTGELKKSVVIFICTFDYFDKDRYMYTFKNRCEEDTSLYLGDERTAIVLNVNGTVGEINEELKGALRYMAGQKPVSDYAEKLDKAVKEVKINEKWRRDYMTLAMKLDENKELAGPEKSISAIRKGKGKCSDELFMEMFDLNAEQLAEITEMINNAPDKSDWDIAEAILFG